MKLETIKKDKRKKIIIGSMIVLSVVGCLTLTTTRSKYRNVQSLKLASGIVKINSYDFKIVAMYQSEDGETYTDINTMPESGYIINEEKSYCTTDNKTQVKGKLKTNSDGEHVFAKLNKNDKCYIWFDKYIVPITIPYIIAAIEKSGASYKGTTAPDFTQVATGAETTANNGIYVTEDPMYGTNTKTYYWRGAATTNHMIFDNKCWRIIRINGDGSIRLIYNGAVQSGNTCRGNGSWDGNVVLQGTAYNGSYDNSSYVGWSYTKNSQRPSSANPQTSGIAAPIKTALESWYSTNITDKSKVVKGNFCNDRNTQNNETWSATGSTQYYASYQRLFGNSDKAPQLSCPDGDIYSLDVGMITADEIQFAGASGSTSNTSYYLYNGQNYWTMSPYYWYSNEPVSPPKPVSLVAYGGDGYFVSLSGNTTNTTYVFTIDNASGYLTKTAVSNSALGLRPVINLRSDVTFNAGSDGAQNNPYIVEA